MNIQILTNYITQAEKQYLSMTKGEKLIFSDMSFWNPAELIGDRPSNLAYSLLNDLIMKKAWNIGLAPLGYPSLSEGLMDCFLYKPYINVNTVFKVLIPTCIPSDIREKLYRFYLDKLRANPQLHDKVEFEIVFSCYDFNAERYQELPLTSKETKELERILIEFTNTVLYTYKAYYNKCLSLIKKLDTYNHTSYKERDIKDMLDKCQEWGTIPFTTVARLAFIAKALLQSLQHIGVITPAELDIIMSSFSTVATELAHDSSIMGREEFMGKYGHLRSGAYNVEEKRYADTPDFNPSSLNTKRPVIPEETKNKINTFLLSSPLNINFGGLYRFAQISFSAREYFKFVYTHTLSNTLELIKEKGNTFGLSPKELSYLNIEDILNLSKNFHNKITTKKQESELWSSIILPPLIFSPKDFWVVSSLESKPNFITSKAIEGDITVLENTSDTIEDKIVFIESADPGYHWIFSKGIKGLVTKYGGMGSHMAICCAEFGIPAAIGCGELYDKLKLRSNITLDCTNRSIK